MDDALDEIARRFEFDATLLQVETAGFSPADWSARPGDRGGNSAHWILGHVTQSRRALLRALGADLGTAPWEAPVGRGGNGDTSSLPAPAALAAEFEQLGRDLASRLRALTPAQASAPFGFPLPDGRSSTLAGASFLQFHEVYHLGQIGLIRRLRGHAGFA